MESIQVTVLVLAALILQWQEVVYIQLLTHLQILTIVLTQNQ